MRAVIRPSVSIPIAIAIGALLAAVARCTLTWYQGGSPDPRCVYGLRGYSETKVLGATKAQDRVICRYRPDQP